MMISCGGNSSNPLGSLGENCYPDGTCDSGYICNLQFNVCLEDVEKNDNTTNDYDAGDTGGDDDTDDAGNTATDTEIGDTDDDSDAGNTGDTGDACTNLSIIEPVTGYENYFALNIVAVINPEDFTGQPEGASYKEFNINITGSPDTDLSPNSIYAVEKTTDDYDYISIYALGDKGENKSTYNTLIITTIPKQGLASMKTNNQHTIDMAPFIRLYKLTELPDRYLKQCEVSMSYFDKPDPNFPAKGKMEVCLEDNENFDSGEVLRIGFNVNMNVDKEEIANLYDYDSVDKLCICYSPTNGDSIECP